MIHGIGQEEHIKRPVGVLEASNLARVIQGGR
jgi:hypothetical protein